MASPCQGEGTSSELMLNLDLCSVLLPEGNRCGMEGFPRGYLKSWEEEVAGSVGGMVWD